MIHMTNFVNKTRNTVSKTYGTDKVGSADSSAIVFCGDHKSIEDINAIANRSKEVLLGTNAQFIQRIDKGAKFLDALLAEEGVIYGVTTGYGDSCTTSVPPHLITQLSKQLYTFHGCGSGDVFSESQSRAILSVRLNSLAQGFSGVRYELLKRLQQLLELEVIPIIPQEGSVGASGDLTPMSYVAAVLSGEREVFYKGQRRATEEVFKELSVRPLQLQPKEGMALMKGTPLMTALACLAFERAKYLCKLSSRITALCSLAVKGNVYHFDELLFSVKKHPGQNQIAAWIHDDLNIGNAPRHDSRLQD